MAKPTLLLDAHLKALRLPTFLREYDKVARQCAQEGLDGSRYRFRLCALELLDREQRAVERRIKAARFPVLKSLETVEFRAIPSVNKRLVLELARSEYLDRRENVLALGNSGTGKTHLAQSSVQENPGAQDLTTTSGAPRGDAGAPAHRPLISDEPLPCPFPTHDDTDVLLVFIHT